MPRKPKTPRTPRTPRTRQAMIRGTAEQHEAWSRAARAESRPLAQWLMLVADRAAGFTTAPGDD